MLTQIGIGSQETGDSVKVNSYYHFDFLLTHLIILKNLQVLNVIFVLLLKIVCMIKVGKGEFLSSYTVRTELIMGVCLALIWID